MRRWFTTLRWASFSAVLIAITALAQQAPPSLPMPRLEYMTPNGGKLGSVVELTVFGTDLEEPESLVFSDPRIKAELVPLPPVPAPDPKKAAPPMMPAGPRKFKVTIAVDAPLGNHDARVVNKYGISNPRSFVVGDLAEVLEIEPNNDVPMAQKITPGTTINGGIGGGTDVDYYSFPGKKGQRMLAYCATSSIDSRARPNVEIFDVNGKRLTANRNYDNNNALADAIIPDDGEYLIRVTEFTYTLGGPQYFYRLSVGNFPWIDGVFPSVVEPGKATPVTLYGRNLPGGVPDPTMMVDGRPLEKLVTTVTAPNDPVSLAKLNYSGRIEPSMSAVDGFEYRLRGPTGASNPVLLTFAEAPVVLEVEGNDKIETAQVVKTPCEIAGRIDKKFDRDCYTFEAKKDTTYTMEVYADRTGTASDLFLRISNAMNQDMGEVDDNPDTMAPVQFYARTSDPQPFRFVAPADGKYFVQVGTRNGNFGPRVTYRLSIVPEKPDFRLIVMPSEVSQISSTIARPDGAVSFDVFVWRRGYNGPITLTMEGLPAGLTAPPQTIMANQKQATLVVSSAPGAAPAVAYPIVKGTATINGQPVVREARPATITWGTTPGQNIPAIARLDRSLVLAVRDVPLFKIVAEPGIHTIKQGEKATLKISAVRQRPELKVPITVTIIGPPNAQLTVNNNQPLALAADKNDGEVVIQSNVALPPGSYNIVLRGSAAFPFAKDPMAKQKPNITATVPALPITVNIIPLALGKVSVVTNPGNFKAGAPGEIVIRVERMYEFAGEYKLKVVLPPDVKGVTIADVTIPPGMTDAKVVLNIAADAVPGARNNLTAQVVAMYEGKTPITQEVKFNINVVK